MAPKASTKKSSAKAPEIVAGSYVRFLGYGEDVPEEERLLEEGALYEVQEMVSESEDGSGPAVCPVLKVDNPDFDESKKPNPKTNPSTLEVTAFPEEVELATDEEVEAYFAEEQEEQEEQEEAPAPEEKPAAKAAKGKAAAAEKPAGKGKAADKPAAKTAKGKAAEKPATKGKAKAKAEEEQEETAPKTDVPDLDHEDEGVLAIVNEAEDLIGEVQDREASIATTEYEMGGLLYHIKRNPELWQSLDPAFAEEGGWKSFVDAYFNLGYRKATQLIAIYVEFNQSGLTNPGEVVSALGWSKAAKLCGYLNKEDVDQAELIKTAEETAAADLSTVLKETYTEGGSGGEKGASKTRIKLRLSFEEERGKIVEDILADATAQFGSPTTEDALFEILSEWRSMNVAGAGNQAAEEQEEQAAPRKGSKPASKPAAKPAGKATRK